MSYAEENHEGKTRRKRLFPPRKVLFPTAAALLASLALPALADLKAQVAADARARLTARAQQLAWPEHEAHVEAWLPASAARLTCQRGLRVEPTRSSDTPWGRVPYTLACAQPQWQLRGRAEVQVWLPVWTARHDIARGRSLEASDLVLKKVELSELHGSFATDAEQLLGYRTRRGVRAGQPVSPGLLAARLLVRKGDNVVIHARGGGMLASMTGTALGDGALREEVKIRNHASGKVISAWVVDSGVVETRF